MKEKQELDRMVGGNIKRERIRAGYTQEQFSEMIGLGTKSLSAIERGTVGVSLTTLLKICDTLAVSTNALLRAPSHENDVQALTAQLEALTPEQLAIAGDVLHRLMDAFAL